MDIELAKQLAAAKVACVSEADAGLIIEEFLRRVAVCSVCGDTGRFAFSRDVEKVPVMNPDAPLNEPLSRTVKAGTKTSCPRCGPSGEGRGDPAFVKWRCDEGKDMEVCQRKKEEEEEARELEEAEYEPQPGDDPGPLHEKCGYHLELPLV